MNRASFFVLCLQTLAFLPAIASALSPSSTTIIGVTYNAPFSPSTPSKPPDLIAAVVSDLHFHCLRLPNADPNLIRSFAFTNISLFLSIPNTFLLPLASNRSVALQWMYTHVLPFYPRTKISLISVGDDAISPELSMYLLPAIKNVRVALLELGINSISVSTTFSFVNIVTATFPPSAAMFQEPINEVLMKPLLQFLEENNSSFVVKLFPYNLHRMKSEIPLGFALFQECAFNFIDDLVTGVRYTNLFDIMVDSLVTSMAVAGHQNIPIIVAETGWPSFSGDTGEVDANPAYAETYLKGLVRHLKSGYGTPLRKGRGVTETYIFELVDKEVNQRTRNWGILHANMTKKYNIEFSGSGRTGVNVAAVMLAAIFFWMVSFSML